MADAPPATQVLARFRRPTAAEPTRLAVLADLHLSSDEAGTWKVFHHTEQRWRAAVADLNDREVDGVLFAGDLTKDGERASFERFDEVLADLRHPFAAIPGNHDLPLASNADPLSVADFETRYSPGGSGYPFAWRVGDLDVIGLNSHQATREAAAETFDGRLTEADLDWLDDALATASNPLVTVHHNLPGTRAVYERLRERLPVQGGLPRFENADSLIETLDAHGVPLVLTGHLHVPLVEPAGSARELTLPPLGSFPAGYVLVTVDERGTTVEFVSVGDVENYVDALAHGYDKDRVLLAAAQMARLPLVDEFAGGQ